jgi:hypothetical protein
MKTRALQNALAAMGNFIDVERGFEISHVDPCVEKPKSMG